MYVGRMVVMYYGFHLKLNKIKIRRSHQMALNRFLHLKRGASTPERWLRYKEEIEEYFILQQIAPAVDRVRAAPTAWCVGAI